MDSLVCLQVSRSEGDECSTDSIEDPCKSTAKTSELYVVC